MRMHQEQWRAEHFADRARAGPRARKTAWPRGAFGPLPGGKECAGVCFLLFFVWKMRPRRAAHSIYRQAKNCPLDLVSAVSNLSDPSLGAKKCSSLLTGGVTKQEDKARVLVGQLSTVGRDVQSTTMHWAYESKKLDTTVKYLSWMPPWVIRANEEGEEDHARSFFFKDTHSTRKPDTVGLGRHPSQWWTMNCKYNAAYDV